MVQDIRPKHKGFYILPNLLTTASLFSGFLGMLWAIEGRFEHCAIAILVSCLFDGMDGKVARLTKASSDFGVQFDSLADLSSFGISPAVMVYLWQTHKFGRIGLVVSFLLVACGALRLARFNVQAKELPKKFFIGLPIPAAACTLATLVLFSEYIPENWVEPVLPKLALILTFVLALAMVSRIKYASFKEVEVVKAHPFTTTVSIIMLFVLVASEPKLLGFLFFIGYLFSGLIYTFLILPLRNSSKLREPRKELS